MKKQRYNLIELEKDLGRTVEELIGYGADEELTIHVIADNWPGKQLGNDEANVTADGPVELVSSDLLKALHSVDTEVRQVKTADGDSVTLDPTHNVPRGLHFVTAAERDRVREALKSTVTASEDTLPPYLDRSHKYYSYTLEAAIKAWMALYANGGFEKQTFGDIDQIVIWLKRNCPEVPSDHARKAIARVVNPNKKGGNPKTRKS